MGCVLSIPGGYRDRGIESISTKGVSEIVIAINVSSMKSLADRVRERRKELGWSQAALASKVPCAQSVIGAIENGTRLNPNLIVEIAAALGVSVNWLKGLSDDPSQEKSSEKPISPNHLELLREFKLLEARNPEMAKIVREHIRQVSELARKADKNDPE